MKETTVPQTVEQKVPETREESRKLIPPVDIFETESGLAVVADLPGVEKEDVEVHVENDVLTLQGKPKTLLPGEPHFREYQLQTFFRQFELGEAVDQDQIRAEMKNGVLTIYLPKTPARTPKKIAVAVS
jgi:HSP20 family protein